MSDKFRENDKYRGNSIDGFFLDEETLEPGTNRHVTTPILDYPEHDNRHSRFGRIVRDPVAAPNWADRLIDVALKHQVTLAMVIWLTGVGLLTWWLF